MAILKVPVTKAGRSIEFDTDSLSEDMYKLVILEGLKAFANKGMSKILTKGEEGAKLDAAKQAAEDKAKENLANLAAGKVRVAKTKTADGKSIPAKVVTKARALAKEVVKNELRNAGIRISTVAASEITRIANGMIEDDPTYYAQATELLAALEAKAGPATAKDDEAKAAAKAEALAKLDKFGGVKVDPALVAKADKAKAAKKASGTLSAKQAGKVAPRKSRGDVAAANA